MAASEKESEEWTLRDEEKEETTVFLSQLLWKNSKI